MRKEELKELISEYQQENRKGLMALIKIFVVFSVLGVVSIILLNLLFGG